MSGKALTTLQTIADRLNLSVSTVSRVLNGRGRQYRISPQTIQAVLEMAEQLHFAPNTLARSLRLNRTQTLGLVIPDISNPFFAGIARNVEIEARRRGYSIILCDTQESTDLEIESIRLLQSRKVEGLIVLPVGVEFDHLRQLSDDRTPIVLTDRCSRDVGLPCIVSDNYGGALHAVTHLIQRGHRQIACLQGLPGTGPSDERLRGYRDALQRHGLPVDAALIAGDGYGEQSGYTAARALLQAAPSVTAVFALSNLIGLGAIRAFAEMHRRIPDDISLVCFDDQPYLAYMNPPITAVDQRNAEMGSAAVRVLFQCIENKSAEPTEVRLETDFIERDSVRSIQSERVEL